MKITKRFHTIIQSKKFVSIFKDVLVSLIIFLFTFPSYEPDYGIGLDPSYVWGLNWLFANDYETLKQLIYPLGPLFILKAPTTESYNFLLYLLNFSILKFILIYLLLKLSAAYHTKKTYAIVFAFIIAYFLSIDLIIIYLCLVLNLFFQKNNKLIFFGWSVIIAFLGLYIKSSIGISALSIVFLSMVYSFLSTKNYRQLIFECGLIFGICLFSGLLVFGSLSIVANYIYGIIRLSMGYGSSLALHPSNNWILITIFIITIVAFPFFVKDKIVRYTFLISIFALFSFWKHAFIREDYTHYYPFIFFIIILWSIMAIISASYKKQIITTLIILIIALYGNMERLPHYSPIKIEICGIINFYNEYIDYKNYTKKYDDISKKNIEKHILDQNVRQIIGNSTIDIYPWEFSYIAANHLKWKPRATVEIGASTSQWTSKKASENYLLKEDSPDFVLFHFVKDKYSGKFGSIDERYLLNDEPIVVYYLFNNYQIVYRTQSFLLFRKSERGSFLPKITEPTIYASFNQWIDVPQLEISNVITRVKVNSKNTFFGKIKNMFYKEEAYYVDYLDDQQNIYSYRYQPTTAVDGLWCHPLYFDVNRSTKILKIRFRNTNNKFVAEPINLQFEYIPVSDSIGCNTII